VAFGPRHAAPNVPSARRRGCEADTPETRSRGSPRCPFLLAALRGYHVWPHLSLLCTPAHFKVLTLCRPPTPAPLWTTRDDNRLLLLTKGRNTIESYFDANGEACIQPNALRIHGKFTESIDWDNVKQRFAITDRQVLELKSIAYEFKRTTTQEYNRAQREVNHPSNAPIHFAFPEFQTDPNGTTRPTDCDRDITKCALVILLIKMAVAQSHARTITCTHPGVGLPVGHGP
jgi:hypothetical protein